MNKLVLVFIYTISTAASFSQSYRPLPEDNAKWCIEHNNHVIPPPPWWYTNYWETRYDGDTVIQNLTYKRIIKTEYDIFCLSEIINGPEYIGAIRDDTIHRKVYLVPPGQENEELIYDFTLLEGDTLYSYLNWYEPILIDHVDSILVGTNYFRTLSFPFEEGSLIEGVGSETGLLEELIAFEGGSYLCALYVDSSLYYPEEACFLVTDTCLALNVDSPVTENSFEIFPNPVRDHFLIRSLSGKQLKYLGFQIYNFTGAPVLSGSITDQAAVDVSNLGSGIYLLRLTDNRRCIGHLQLIKN